MFSKRVLRLVFVVLGVSILSLAASNLVAQPLERATTQAGDGNGPGIANQRLAFQEAGPVENRNSRGNIDIVLTTEKSSVKPGEDLRFSVETDRDCYLTLLHVSESGKVVMLWPNSESGWKNRVRAGVQVEIPQAGSSIRLQVDGRQPYERIVAVASSEPDALIGRKDTTESAGQPVRTLAMRSTDLREELRHRARQLPQSVDWGTASMTVRVASGRPDRESFIESLSPPHETMEMVKDLNETIKQKGYNWTAGITDLSELSEEEQRDRCGAGDDPREMEGVEGDLPDEEDQEVLEGTAGARPAAWDWRNVNGKDWTTPIRDQGGCGSCGAFALNAVIETAYQIQQKKAPTGIDLSEAHPFFCGCGKCCGKGWYLDKAFIFAKKIGVLDEKAYPYQDKDQDCSAKDTQAGSVRTKITCWYQIKDPERVKNWVSRKYPVAVWMRTFSDLFNYKTGVYKPTTKKTVGAHFVAIVGYNDQGQYWICKNSWGTKWGENGWFKIGYGQSEMGTFPFHTLKLPIKRVKQQ